MGQKVLKRLEIVVKRGNQGWRIEGDKEAWGERERCERDEIISLIWAPSLFSPGTSKKIQSQLHGAGKRLYMYIQYRLFFVNT